MWNRLVSLISQFESEHSAYGKFIFDGFNLKSFAFQKWKLTYTGQCDLKLLKIGREVERPKSPGYLAREAPYRYYEQSEAERKS